MRNVGLAPFLIGAPYKYVRSRLTDPKEEFPKYLYVDLANGDMLDRLRAYDNSGTISPERMRDGLSEIQQILKGNK